MLKRYILYFFIFLASFLLFFILTFPVDRIVYSKLTEKGFQVGTVEGNLLQFQIYSLENEIFKMNKITVNNNFLKISVNVNNQLFLTVTPLSQSFNGEAKINNVGSFLKKIKLSGSLTGKIKGYIKDEHILLNGKINSLVQENSYFPERNIKIQLNISSQQKTNQIEGSITSKNINLKFDGKGYFPLSLETGYIKVNLSGIVYSSNIKKEINLPLTSFQNPNILIKNLF